MKIYFGMLVAAGLCGSVAAQVVTSATITPTHIGGVEIGGVEGFNHDLFDGTVTVTAHSPLHPASDPVGADNWFISPNAETEGHSPPGLLVFADTNLPNYIEFNTADEVALGSMVFYLSGDHNTDSGGYEGRSLSNLVVSAGTASNALAEVANIAVDPDYDGAYGMPWIKVMVEFPAPVTAKYFRIDIEQPDIGAAKPEWTWNGPRIREIDAYGTNVATTASFTAKAIGEESIDGASNDNFEGATVTTNSALHPATGISTDYWFISPNAAGELIMDDNAGTRFIEFSTPQAYSMSNIVVSISADNNEFGLEGRAISGIRILSGLSPESVTENVVCFVTFPGEYTDLYGSNWLEVNIALDPAFAIGQYFRIELDQFGSGTRIMEIDGYGEVFVEDILQPAIKGWSRVSDTVMRMVVDAPVTASRYAPQGRTDLNIGTWVDVPHSDDGTNPFVVTNLDYSTTDATGTNEVIYVQSDDAEEFFRIIGN